MFWLPVLMILIFVTAMSYVGEKGWPGVSFSLVLLHTVIVRIAFLDHPLFWIILFSTILLWVVFIVTYFQRDRWRNIEKLNKKHSYPNGKPFNF